MDDGLAPWYVIGWLILKSIFLSAGLRIFSEGKQQTTRAYLDTETQGQRESDNYEQHGEPP